MAIPNKHSLKRPRVIEERFESDDSEIESEEDDEVEHGDDLDDIKQEIDDWNDSWDDVEMIKDDYLEEVDDKSEIKCLEETPNGAGNGILSGKESSDEEEHFGDVESDDEKPPIKDPDIKKKTKKKVVFAEPESSSDSESDAIEEDDEDDEDGDDEGEEGEKKVGKRGLANVMSKILGTKKKGGEILSKAKKDYELEDKDKAFQIVDDKGKIKKMVKIEEEEEGVKLGPHMRHILREKWLKQFRKMPNVVDDREYERKFKTIATQGVVQLFSAITKHKSLVEKENKEQKSIVARELLLEKTEKSSFLKVLQKEGKKVAKAVEEVEIKKEEKEEDVPSKKPRWSALSKDFYQEPSLKGWDQQSDDD